jgi:hypothetical protein
VTLGLEVTANYLLRSSVAAILLLLPFVVSRLGFGTKKFWSMYAFGCGGFFLTFAVAGWLVSIGMNVTAEPETLRDYW